MTFISFTYIPCVGMPNRLARSGRHIEDYCYLQTTAAKKKGEQKKKKKVELLSPRRPLCVGFLWSRQSGSNKARGHWAPVKINTISSLLSARLHNTLCYCLPLCAQPISPHSHL